jgi:cell wall assembly regulator SMI1
MNRRFSALILSGLGAGALYSASLDSARDAEPAADPAAVDRYLAQLSETVPPPVATALAREAGQPKDPNLTKRAAKLDRAEPMVGAAFSIVR